MKGILFALLMLFSLEAYAQVRVRKVPFLPYVGAGGGSGVSGGGTGTVNPSQNTEKRTVRISFKKGSSSLSPAAKAAIKRIANYCGDKLVVITGYYSRRVSIELARARCQSIKDSFGDLNVSSWIGDIHFRNDSSSVVDINQVIVEY